ncbi:MAG: Gfo/Idh/MocA family oxidoreductase [Bacilli bacterium]
MKRLRCGIVGLGRLGVRHANNLNSTIGAGELVAVADVMPFRAKEFADRLEIPRHYENPLDLIRNPDIDSVIIVTPTDTHFALATAAIQANKSIFLEKPMASTKSQSLELGALARQRNVYCQVGFMRRYDSAYAFAKQQVAEGKIGKPIYFKAVSRDPDCPPEDYIKESGGIFTDLAIHDYDIARFLMGSDIVRVQAMGKVLVNGFLESYDDVDQAVSYVEFANGAAGDIESSRNAGYGYDIRAEVIGTEGTLRIGSLQDHAVELLSKNGQSIDIVPGFIERFADAYRRELEDFVHRVLLGRESPITVADGVAAMAVAEAAANSYRSRRLERVAADSERDFADSATSLEDVSSQV